jgi:hypothetical protein
MFPYKKNICKAYRLSVSGSPMCNADACPEDDHGEIAPINKIAIGGIKCGA